ncbi:MAG: sensor histidine kinase [Rickettsiales bacterium]
MSLSVQQWMQRGVMVMSLLLLMMLLLVFSMTAVNHLRDDYERELRTQAAMVNDDLLSAWGNPKRQQGILERLAANTELLRTCTTNTKSKVLAHWSPAPKKESADACLEDIQKQKGRWFKAIVHVPVMTNTTPARELGSIWLMSGFPSIFSHFGESMLSMLGAVFVFMIIGFIFVQRMQVILLRPVRQIANTAQRVSLYKDFSLRVSPGPLTNVPLEIEVLIDSFNSMLKEIEDRDGKLLRKNVELEKARQAAEAANIAKSQFLANISHELRTPLNSIIGFSTMIKDQQYGEVGDPKYLEYAGDIYDSGKHLLEIINDILDLSKAEAGKLSIKHEHFQIEKAIDKAINLIAHRAQQGQVTVYTDIPEKLPRIIADRVRLLQILLNIISNAVKFTREGGHVIVRVRAEEGANHIHYFTIEVADTGIGMTKDEIQQAFQPFQQGDGGLNRKYEGTGLGLPLTRKLVELHNGKITIESEKGKGTNVRIQLISNPALLD